MTIVDRRPKGLVPVSIATLLPDSILGVEVFVRAASGLPPSKLFEAYDPVDPEKLQKYIDAGVKSVFILSGDQARYQQYLTNYWNSILKDQVTPLPKRLRIMGEVVRGVVNEQFQANETQQLVESSATLARTAVHLISDNEVALDQLCDVLHHDYGTFTHSTNVAFYSILLAKKLGYSIEEQQEIAVGAMLHDLGKLEIDTRILNKPSKLNIQELQVLKRHPSLAFKRLVNREDVSFGQLMMAYQHHERFDGQGYPCGVPGELIHPYAKICAVVDVYEAITSERPYRMPMEREVAIQIIKNGFETHFDSDTAKAWIEVVLEGAVQHV